MSTFCAGCKPVTYPQSHCLTQVPPPAPVLLQAMKQTPSWLQEDGDTPQTWLNDHPQLVERMVLPGVVHVLAQESPSRCSLQAGVR